MARMLIVLASVNVVVPGPTHDGMGDVTSPEFREILARKIPLRRLGTAAEVAHAVRFLLDDMSGYITGTAVTVDGGMSMG